MHWIKNYRWTLLVMVGLGLASSWTVKADTTETEEKPLMAQRLEEEAKRVAQSVKEEVKEAAVRSYTPNTYPVGQCTWGAKELAPWLGSNWGNAGEWAGQAAAQGFTVADTPRVGAVMVWTDGGYGHVAVVTDVAADGKIQVQESNYAGNQTIGNYRGFFDPAGEALYAKISYIYPKSMTA